MTRTFLHSFDPSSASPITGATADLDVADIEEAGIREALQTRYKSVSLVTSTTWSTSPLRASS